jgi:hypothetical protein
MIRREIRLSGMKKLLRSLASGSVLKITETIKKAMNGMKCSHQPV